MANFLPFALPDIDEEEIKEVIDTLRSGWLTTGPKVKEFEARFAVIVGARHAVVVKSCTADMHLDLEAIDRSYCLPNSVTQNIHFVSTFSKKAICMRRWATGIPYCPLPIA